MPKLVRRHCSSPPSDRASARTLVREAVSSDTALLHLASPGKDATEAFEDVGHSEEARKLLEPMLLGDFDGVVSDLRRLSRRSTRVSKLSRFILPADQQEAREEGRPVAQGFVAISAGVRLLFLPALPALVVSPK